MSTVDLSTRYLGLHLKNPLIASACPMTGNVDTLQSLEQAGAAAAVLPSLFEEQITHEELEIHRLYEYSSEAFAESLSYFPELEDYNTGPDAYLRHVSQAREAVKIPIIGSLNGSSRGGWIHYAQSIEQAGANALELNIYFVPTDAQMSGADVERRYLELVSAVRKSISIPLGVKIGPYFSSLPHFARQLIDAGADGLVLFNRYLEPDINLDELAIEPNLVLSSRHELRLPLRWIAILRDQLASTSIAATSGVHFAEDVIKALLVGADAVMMASVVLRYGPSCLHKLLEEVSHWMVSREYESVEQMKGSMSRVKCDDPSALERSNYMKALISFTDRREVSNLYGQHQ